MLEPILVTGSSGQVGGAVVRLARSCGHSVHAPLRAQLDLTDSRSIRAVIAEGKWRAIINCAAYTAVDRAESEPAIARAVNATAPSIIAEAAARRHVPVIHVSTDYVFDGTKQGYYREDDPVNPVSVYGRTKQEGEEAIIAAGGEYAIIRTAWVLSVQGANFLNTMLQLAANRAEVRVVDDQLGCPTSADDIASALLEIVGRNMKKSGIWHYANAGETNWHDLAAYVFCEAGQRGLPTPTLLPISTKEYPTAAQRPANSRLSTDKIANDFGIVPRPWQDAVANILAERLGPK